MTADTRVPPAGTGRSFAPHRLSVWHRSAQSGQAFDHPAAVELQRGTAVDMARQLGLRTTYQVRCIKLLLHRWDSMPLGGAAKRRVHQVAGRGTRSHPE
jgi:hypothetical protein